MAHELVLAGGRVVDPETGFDRVCDVGIDGGSVTAIGDDLVGTSTVDVGGLVVAPGFIDLHSHAQTLPGRRLQACDGVTTALDLGFRIKGFGLSTALMLPFSSRP